MKKKNRQKWLAALLSAAVLTGFAGCTEVDTPVSSSDAETASTETTAAETTETTAAETASETEPNAETTAETIPAPTESGAAETTAQATAADAGNTAEYAETAKCLLGALDYIDRIGSGNLPKDENDIVQSAKYGAVYEKVAKTQFFSTADLKGYLESNLTQKMIDARYSAILGTDQPLYIDANGGLYGRQYATSGGFAWLDPEQVEVANVTENSFAASIQYDNFGATAVLTVQIVMDGGQWKIDSIQ